MCDHGPPAPAPHPPTPHPTRSHPASPPTLPSHPPPFSPQDGAGRSRGFGTVLFTSTRDAAKAIQLFNETELNGRTIEVRPDQYS
jgi:hypothetical protein